MKKLLLLLIITGQTTFGIDKKLVGSLALGGVGTIVTIWSGLSVFGRSSTFKALKADSETLARDSNDPENTIKKRMYTNAKKLKLLEWEEDEFLNNVNLKQFLVYVNKNKPSYIVPACIGALSSLLLFYSYRRYKSLKN